MKKGSQCYFRIQDTEFYRYLLEDSLLPDSTDPIVCYNPGIVTAPTQSSVSPKMYTVHKTESTEKLRFYLIYKRANKPEFERDSLTNGCGLENITTLRFLALYAGIIFIIQECAN